MNSGNRTLVSAVLLCLALVLLSAFVFVGAPKQAERPWLDAALAAAEWIGSTEVKAEAGVAWPADPGETDTVQENLYSGTPGVVLFFIEAWSSTGEVRYLDTASAGAEHLLAVLEGEQGCGLYEGVAGIGFALEEAYRATGRKDFREGALRCLRLIEERAVEAGAGVEWGGTTDVISGAAGTGLFLLYAAGEMEQPEALELAAAAGRRLAEVAIETEGGLKWAMHPEYPRLMPNFSHGTAGVCYFLTRLHEATGDEEFLRAAIAGARYLQSIAVTDGGACLVFHHEPDGTDLFYLGWCHGPVGTARLFVELARATGEAEWREWAERCARGILDSGIPKQQTPGFWNNVSVCCGSAGVAEFFLDMHAEFGKEEYLDFAREVAEDMVARGTREGGGLKWVQAEHRTMPEFLVAQTGYMQGAAGIGTVLLRLDAHQRGADWRIRFPDSPF